MRLLLGSIIAVTILALWTEILEGSEVNNVTSGFGMKKPLQP